MINYIKDFYRFISGKPEERKPLSEHDKEEIERFKRFLILASDLRKDGISFNEANVIAHIEIYGAIDGAEAR